MTSSNQENKIKGITVVTEKSLDFLNPRQLESYRLHREKMIKWMLNLGKDPEKAQGYARATAETRAKRLEKFYRWVWAEEDKYTEVISTEHADLYMKHLAHQDFTSAYKNCCQKAVKTLFKWRNWEFDAGIDWDPVINYRDDTGTDQPRDFLTGEERVKLREAVMDYGTIPHYNSVTPEERDKWKAYLAQRFGKKKSEITLDDWDRANSFKIPSLVLVSLDAGLRPVEVERATVDWVDLDNGVLRIPKEESSKNSDNWIIPLMDRTVNYLDRWLKERRFLDKYSGRRELWLTSEGNPYDCHSLRYVMEKLCELAGIDDSSRSVTWYSIRHSTATYMARAEGIGAAQQQLRHKSERTTMKYDQAPVEDRREALRSMEN